MDARISKYKMHAINIKILIAVILIFWLRSGLSANSLSKFIIFLVCVCGLKFAPVLPGVAFADCLAGASVLVGACIGLLCISGLPFDGMGGSCLL